MARTAGARMAALVPVLAVAAACLLGAQGAPAGANDVCQRPGSCTPPAAKWAVELPISPRRQWGDSGGYCGALSVQQGALNVGAWISQDKVRKAAGPGGGHGSHGNPKDGYEILHTNVDGALRKLKLDYDAWDWQNSTTPQTNGFIAWMKKHLMAGHLVVWMVMCKGDGHDTYGLGHYDHVEPVFGIYSNLSRTDPAVSPDDVLVHSSNWDQNKYYRPLSSLADSLKMDGNCSRAVAGWPHDEAYPCIYDQVNYGVAITGATDPAGKSKPISVGVDRWDEPDLPSGESAANLHANVTVHELTAQASYTLYRYATTADVPVDGSYDTGFAAKHEFQATGPTYSYADPTPVLSSTATYYRCVPN